MTGHSETCTLLPAALDRIELLERLLGEAIQELRWMECSQADEAAERIEKQMFEGGVE